MCVYVCVCTSHAHTPCRGWSCKPCLAQCDMRDNEIAKHHMGSFGHLFGLLDAKTTNPNTHPRTHTRTCICRRKFSRPRRKPRGRRTSLFRHHTRSRGETGVGGERGPSAPPCVSRFRLVIQTYRTFISGVADKVDLVGATFSVADVGHFRSHLVYGHRGST